ncbi:MAG: phosphoribosylamine--glycine ligase [Phycisphaeraceae bacterium]|nr:MAG: phosphoribosylamine--glycine ligase [Phycisphaeraceae bacterium]
MKLAETVNVLLIGGGGREHALARAIARSPRLGTLHVTHPGNPGIAALGTAVDVPVNKKELYRLQQYADRHSIHLVVIGPEDPLADGFADALAARIDDGAPRAVFGPTAEGARLEADKAWAKQLMRAASIPTAEGRVFERADAAIEYLETRDEPHVIKAAGLAKGKGVIVPHSVEQSIAAVTRIMTDRAFGDAGNRVLVEEKLNGTEVSVLAICDGRTILTLPPCQDHKRLKDHDAGPNTGGMGAFCPAPTIDDETLTEVERDVLVPIIDALRREDVEFRGVLYAGIMLTPGGPKVLEFNVRFGDPECQPLLARLESDALELMLAAARGTLADLEVKFSEQAAVTVVLASAGYPDAPRPGDTITGVGDAEAMAGVTVDLAGVAMHGSKMLTAGGRVLSVTALGDSLAEARDLAYAAADKIHFDGKQMRRDIAAHAAATTG